MLEANERTARRQAEELSAQMKRAAQQKSIAESRTATALKQYREAEIKQP